MKTLAQMLSHSQTKRDQAAQVIAEAYADPPGHISDHDLERYHLGMVTEQAELAALEEHLLWCGLCIERAAAVAQYVDAVRAAACNLPE